MNRAPPHTAHAMRPIGAPSARAEETRRRSPSTRSSNSLFFQRPADFIQDRGVIDRRRHRPNLAVGDLFHGTAQDLARPGLRQPRHGQRELESRNRTDLLPYQSDDLALNV